VTNESTTVAQTGVEQLYEQAAGPVFAYCYARFGSRTMAEWAVTATFDRARAALAKGGIPEPELDWLLRTADKFCAPRLRLDGSAVAGETVLVMQDWRGRSFDEIEAELATRQARLEQERNRLTPWRRLLGALNLGPAASWAKGLFAGASAVKATAAAVAVVGAIVVVATPVATKLHDAVNPPDKSTPTGGSGADTPRPAQRTVPAPASRPARGGHVPASAAVGTGAVAEPARSHPGRSGKGAASTAPTPSSSRGGTAAVTRTGGGAPSTASSAPVLSSSAAPPRTSGSATAPAGTVKPKPPDDQTISPPAPSVKPKPPAVTAPALTAPTTSLPQTPTVSTPAVPSPSDVPATLPSVPDTPTPTLPSVSTPSVPSTPSTPSPSSVPSTGSAPSPPSVSTPSVPPPPPAPTVTLPTVTLPGK
jgi:hypothetical protein